MNWKFFCTSLVAAALVAGCSSSSDNNGGKGSLGKTAFDAKVGELNKWHDVSLQEIADGSFKGTAITARGEKLNVAVERGPNKISSQWKNADGSGGGSSSVSW